jgi:hypothetical protein
MMKQVTELRLSSFIQADDFPIEDGLSFVGQFCGD